MPRWSKATLLTIWVIWDNVYSRNLGKLVNRHMVICNHSSILLREITSKSNCFCSSAKPCLLSPKHIALTCLLYRIARQLHPPYRVKCHNVPRDLAANSYSNTVLRVPNYRHYRGYLPIEVSPNLRHQSTQSQCQVEHLRLYRLYCYGADSLPNSSITANATCGIIRRQELACASSYYQGRYRPKDG